MKIAIGCDHGGIVLKNKVIQYLQDTEYEIVDKGCPDGTSVDYPVFADAVCQELIAQNCEKGILICGTGIGMSIAANKYSGIRAALCHDAFTAKMSREHNDANVLCIGERVTGSGVALDMVKIWLQSDFSGGRHLRRIQMFA